MKDWLSKKEDEQKSLFKDFLNKSMQTLNAFNEAENKNISVRVIFSKDNWLEGNVIVEFLKKTKTENLDRETDESEYDYMVVSEYNHSVYNSGKDIYSNSLLSKLMVKGLFTNNWFSVLDTSRKYDTTFILSGEEYVLENDACEYRENRMAKSHSGFNIEQPKKNGKLKI